MALLTIPLGPFTRGVVDTRNASMDAQSALRYARNLMYRGVGELSIRPGSQTQLTLLDDAGTPAEITSVVAKKQFADGALIVGHSTVTDKCYLYRLTATMDGWYDNTGTLTSPAITAEPIGVLWSGMTAAPDVQIDEGLGVAYIANTGALDKDGLYWPTRTYEDFSTLADLVCNGTGGAVGTDVAHATGLVSYNQHLWMFGYGAGSTPGFTSYRPELARFSRPNFGPFQTVDSITLGDSVRSLRERIIAGAVADDALYLGGQSILTQVTGSGRDSWYRRILDRSYGFVGPKCYVTVGRDLYYWSPRGPMRIRGGSADPLWDAIPDAVSRVANVAKIVAAFDVDRDQVLFFYDTGSGVRTFCAFDTRRDVWLGPDSDIGLAIGCAASIEPVYQSTIIAPIGPSGPPVAVSTTSIGASTATANWTNGDEAAQLEISYRPQTLFGFPPEPWIVLPLLPAGTTSYTFSGLSSGIFGGEYEWRIRHVRNGQFTAYSGPSAATEFTTTPLTLLPPSSLVAVRGGGVFPAVSVSWVNSGEASVQTEIWVLYPGDADYSLVLTVASGVSNTSFFISGSLGAIQVKARHVRGSEISAYSNTDSA